MPRYQHKEMPECFSQVIWVEPRENALAPVGEGFLFKVWVTGWRVDLFLPVKEG